MFIVDKKSPHIFKENQIYAFDGQITNIIFNNAINDNTIILFDHLGKVCDNIQSQNIEAGGKITVDVSNLSSGLYFIHLINDNTSLKQCFTVNK